MAKYTDKQYYIDEGLRKKLDLMVGRMQGKVKKDNVLIVEGDEGDGKTNMSVLVGHYVGFKTGRKFNEDNLYFDLGKLIEDAKSTEEQIFIWDEPALTSLRSDWAKEVNKNLVRLVMMARKKKHFIIFNFTKFFKFDEYLVVDRSIGMIHVYSENELTPGRFVYYKKRSKEMLYYYWRSTKRRAYRKFYTLRGSFPYVLPQLINEEKYEERKDAAIMQIGVKEVKELTPRQKAKEKKLQYYIGKLDLKTEELAKHFDVDRRTIQRWKTLKDDWDLD